MSNYPYTQYLNSKATVDDRALNKDVFEGGRREIGRHGSRECTLVELGGGLGTMVARLIRWNLVERARYILVDVDEQLLSDARAWLTDWATRSGLTAAQDGDALR